MTVIKTDQILWIVYSTGVGAIAGIIHKGDIIQAATACILIGTTLVASKIADINKSIRAAAVLTFLSVASVSFAKLLELNSKIKDGLLLGTSISATVAIITALASEKLVPWKAAGLGTIAGVIVAEGVGGIPVCVGTALGGALPTTALIAEPTIALFSLDNHERQADFVKSEV